MVTVPKTALSDKMSLEPFRSIKVLIAYDGFESGLHAAELYQRMARQFDQDYAFEVGFWRFEVLSVPTIRERATREAVQADVVIVSVDARGNLPTQGQVWFEEWIKKKLGQDSALVVLSGQSCAGANPSTAAHGYLRRMAERGGMAFLSDTIEGALEAKVQGVRQGRQRHDSSRTAATNEPGATHPYFHWGINE